MVRFGAAAFAFAAGSTCWPRKQISSLNTKSARKPIHDVNPRSIDASLKRTDVRAIDLGPVRQFFLRQASLVAKSPQVDRQNLSYVHVREGIGLQSISPRSILDKTNKSASDDLVRALRDRTRHAPAVVPGELGRSRSEAVIC